MGFYIPRLYMYETKFCSMRQLSIIMLMPSTVWVFSIYRNVRFGVDLLSCEMSFCETDVLKTVVEHILKISGILATKKHMISKRNDETAAFLNYKVISEITFIQDRRSALILLNEKRHEKTNVLVSDLVRHKPGCPATEDA